MKFEVDKYKQTIAELGAKHDLELVLLFGSQASGKVHAQSDVDIAVYAKEKFRPMDLAKLQFEFSSALKIEDVELTDLKGASPLLLKEVADNSILLYEKNENFYDEMKVYFLRIYYEARPLLRMRAEQFAASLRKV